MLVSERVGAELDCELALVDVGTVPLKGVAKPVTLHSVTVAPTAGA